MLRIHLGDFSRKEYITVEYVMDNLASKIIQITVVFPLTCDKFLGCFSCVM